MPQTGLGNQIGGVTGQLIVVNLPTHNHAAVDVGDHVQTEELTTDQTGQVGDSPTPALVRATDHQCTWLGYDARGLCATPAVDLSTLVQHPVEGRLAG